MWYKLTPTLEPMSGQVEALLGRAYGSSCETLLDSYKQKDTHQIGVGHESASVRGRYILLASGKTPSMYTRCEIFVSTLLRPPLRVMRDIRENDQNNNNMQPSTSSLGARK